MGTWPPTKLDTGDMVDDNFLNDNWGDNLTELGQNAHTGASGDGSAAINPATVTLDSSSAPSTPAAGKLVMWVDGETLKVKDSTGTVTAVSLEGHTH
jgi:hypothetical protein